ncbi:cytochrome P450 3A24-like isoform X2 [Tachypleus tridentatus]|uniref:cytochrome P450 3A24-like isoform X2 n=1 Tax=Tachypleus tridentatus TaxID=6853 RepID=UPI003FCF6FE0
MFGPVTIVLFIILFTIWILRRRKHFNSFVKLGFPGPKPNLFFGNMWELYWKGPLSCLQNWIDQYGNVFIYFFGMRPVLVVMDLDLLKEILIKDFMDFADRPGLFELDPPRKPGEPINDFLIFLRGTRWKRVRSVITPSFTTLKLKTMAQTMDETINDLFRNIEEYSRQENYLDVYKLFQAMTMDVMVKCALGIDAHVQKNPMEHELIHHAKVIFGTSIQSLLFLIHMSFPAFGWFTRNIRHLQYKFWNKGSNPFLDLVEVCRHVMKSRAADPAKRRNDLLQLMMDSQNISVNVTKVTGNQLTAGEETYKSHPDESTHVNDQFNVSKSGLSDNEVLYNAMLALVAGYETTSSALGYTIHLLVQHPKVQEKLRQEVDEFVGKGGNLDYLSVHKLRYLDQVFSECLRVYPPVFLFVNREANRDITYGSIQIPKGTAVQVPVYHLHHNPALWPDHETFDPERFSVDNHDHHPLAWQPFGHGPRNCIGMRFAQLEAKMAITRIVQKYYLMPCEKTEKKLTVRLGINIMNPANGVFVKFIPRNSPK